MLTGAIPGLMRRGSPAWWRDEETPYIVTMTYADADEAVWMVGAPCLGIPIGVQDEPSNFVLDLTDPTGRYHALLWLRERGHDLRWAEDEAEVLAWSVLSVVRGGEPIVDLLDVWKETTEECDPRYGRWFARASVTGRGSQKSWPSSNHVPHDTVLTVAILPTQFDGHVAHAALGAYSSQGPTHAPPFIDPPCLLSDAATAQKHADSAALKARYALRNKDGTLTLPTLPEVTHV